MDIEKAIHLIGIGRPVSSVVEGFFSKSKPKEKSEQQPNWEGAYNQKHIKKLKKKHGTANHPAVDNAVLKHMVKKGEIGAGHPIWARALAHAPKGAYSDAYKHSSVKKAKKKHGSWGHPAVDKAFLTHMINKHGVRL